MGWLRASVSARFSISPLAFIAQSLNSISFLLLSRGRRRGSIKVSNKALTLSARYIVIIGSCFVYIIQQFYCQCLLFYQIFYFIPGYLSNCSTALSIVSIGNIVNSWLIGGCGAGNQSREYDSINLVGIEGYITERGEHRAGSRSIHLYIVGGIPRNRQK